MNEILKAAFTKEQLALAATIGDSTAGFRDKVSQLFTELGDPLLSAADIPELLATAPEPGELDAALEELVSARVLERSDDTTRPLDHDLVPLYRRLDVAPTRLRIVALESKRADGSTRLQFTCDARLIRSLACVDRLDALAGSGHQREEMISHVRKIAEGIQGGTQIPNPVLLVLQSDRVADYEDTSAPLSFVRVRPLADWVSTPGLDGQAEPTQEFRTIELEFPFRWAAFDEEKIALLVDGQQRTAALALVDKDVVPNVQVGVDAVFADADEAKRIFQIANSTQKIQTQFSRALLATMKDAPGYLRQERAKALAAKLLALDNNTSPFQGLVQYPGHKSSRRAPIAYNSLFQVVVEFADSALSIGDTPELLAPTVATAFGIVRETWPDAWGLKPKESRLMHGAGLRAMASFLVSKLEAARTTHGDDDDAVWSDIRDTIRRLEPAIVWTDAAFANGSQSARKFYRDHVADRQNTSQDIAELTREIKKLSMSLDQGARKAQKKTAPSS